MLRKKLKEINKDNNSNNNRDLILQNKIQTIKSLNPNINYKKIEKITKKNLPELRLSKLKSRIESEINSTYKSINQSNINIKNISDIQIQNIKLIPNNKPKNNSLTKKNDVIFPKIKNSIINNHIYKQNEKYNSLDNSNENNYSISNEYRNVNNNTINNVHAILNKMHIKKNDIINNNNISELKKKRKKLIISFLEIILVENSFLLLKIKEFSHF